MPNERIHSRLQNVALGRVASNAEAKKLQMTVPKRRVPPHAFSAIGAAIAAEPRIIFVDCLL